MGAAPKFRLIASRIALATALAAGVAATSWAQDAKAPDAPAAPPQVTITPPSDPVAKAAFDVLERNCGRCHQAGKLVDRERPAKGFGNILKLDELAANPHLINPGNPLEFLPGEADSRQADAL